MLFLLLRIRAAEWLERTRCPNVRNPASRPLHLEECGHNHFAVGRDPRSARPVHSAAGPPAAAAARAISVSQWSVLFRHKSWGAAKTYATRTWMFRIFQIVYSIMKIKKLQQRLLKAVQCAYIFILWSALITIYITIICLYFTILASNFTKPVTISKSNSKVCIFSYLHVTEFLNFEYTKYCKIYLILLKHKRPLKYTSVFRIWP